MTGAMDGVEDLIPHVVLHYTERASRQLHMPYVWHAQWNEGRHIFDYLKPLFEGIAETILRVSCEVYLCISWSFEIAHIC